MFDTAETEFTAAALWALVARDAVPSERLLERLFVHEIPEVRMAALGPSQTYPPIHPPRFPLAFTGFDAYRGPRRCDTMITF